MDSDMKWKLEILKRLTAKNCECVELGALLQKHGQDPDKCISCQAGGLLNRINEEIFRCYDEIVADYPMLESAINRNC